MAGQRVRRAPQLSMSMNRCRPPPRPRIHSLPPSLQVHDYNELFSLDFSKVPGGKAVVTRSRSSPSSAVIVEAAAALRRGPSARTHAPHGAAGGAHGASLGKVSQQAEGGLNVREPRSGSWFLACFRA